MNKKEELKKAKKNVEKLIQELKEKEGKHTVEIMELNAIKQNCERKLKRLELEN